MIPALRKALKMTALPMDCNHIESFDQDNLEELNIGACVETSEIMDITWRLLRHPPHQAKLVELGLFESIPTEEEVVALFTRVLFQPATDLVVEAGQVVEKLRQLPSSGNPANKTANKTTIRGSSDQFRQVIGLQIRTGGLLANTPETSVFLTKEKIDIMMERIRELVTNHTLSLPVVFVSSDSSDAIVQIQSTLPYPVYASDVYRIGHSSPWRSHYNLRNVYKRNMIDILVLAQCDYLVTTKDSSFGLLALSLSKAVYKRALGA